MWVWMCSSVLLWWGRERKLACWMVAYIDIVRQIRISTEQFRVGRTTKKKPSRINSNTFMHDPYQRPIPSTQSSHICSAKKKRSEIRVLCSNKFQMWEWRQRWGLESENRSLEPKSIRRLLLEEDIRKTRGSLCLGCWWSEHRWFWLWSRWSIGSRINVSETGVEGFETCQRLPILWQSQSLSPQESHD